MMRSLAAWCPIAMIRTPVVSSDVASIAYDWINRTLEVEFRRNKAVYQYFNVPEDIYIDILEGEGLE